MDKIEKLLPLGSIVNIEGGYRKYVIVARGLQVDIHGEKKFFDYGAAFYPDGVTGDRVMYFQNKDVRKVIFEGFSDDDDKLMVESIIKAFADQNLEHADTKQLKDKYEGK